MKNNHYTGFPPQENSSINLFLKIMRVTVFILCFCTFSAIAGNVSSQNAKVSIKKTHAPLEEILSEIENQTDYLFMYSDAIDVKQRASIQVTKTAVAEVLKKLFDGKVAYEMEGKHIILSPRTTEVASNQQDKNTIIVTGQVVDELGEPIIGATIMEKGVPANGTITDIDGRFSMKISRGTMLQVSYIGYKTMEVKADGATPLKIQLQEDSKQLEEVVVMGYTTQSRNTLTGAATALNEKKLKDVAAANVSAMLEGKVSGMSVNTPSGKPGEVGKIEIRGKGSLGSSLDPIWVVDGIIYNSDPRLSPNEIDNITVLKDASSTALYGSRASNGVIVVTTKKGGIDHQRFNVNISGGISDLSWGNLKMMDSQQLYDYESKFNSSSWFTPDLLKHNTDWMDLATQTGFYTNASISYQGGNEKLNSYLLLDYYRETGAVKDMNFNRYTIRSNNDYKIHKNFQAFTRLQGQYVKTKDQTADLYGSYLYLPWDYPYNEDGSIRNGHESDWYGRDQSSYLEYQKKDFGAYENFYISASAGFTWTLMKGLTFESNNNVNYKIARDESYADPTTFSGQNKSGTIKNTYSINSNYFTNQMLRYKTVLKEKHGIQALLAYEYARNYWQETSATAKGISSGKEVIDGTTGMDKMTGNKSAYNIQSVLSNINYSYDGRYILQASYRLDGSSKFGKNHQYGSFYTFSGAWNFSQEKFFAPLSDIVTNGKLRASWGVVGNMPGGAYNHLSLYLSKMYNGDPANFPDQLGNKDLSWEKNQTTNIGIDISLFDRVNISLDYYDKYTFDLLYYVKLTSITGYGGQWQNIGSLRNKGIELSINADIYKNKDWNVNAGFNISHNKNCIKELYGGLPQISGLRRFEEGRDMDELWMAEWAGVDSETGAPQWYATNKEGERVLTNTYSAAYNSRVYMGTAAPKAVGGFNAAVSWKNLSLQAAFAYSIGGKLYASGRELLDSDGAYDTYNQMVLKDGWTRWEKPGDVATHPKAVSGGNSNSNKTSSRYLEDADYLTMRNLIVSYALPQNWLTSLGVTNVTLSFSADNLFTITPYSQVDPSTASYDRNGMGRSSVYPTTRKYVFGMSVGF